MVVGIGRLATIHGMTVAALERNIVKSATSVPSIYDTEGNMLVLGRKSGESIRIGEGIQITVVGINGNRVRLGIEAPDSVRVLRAELDQRASTACGSAPGGESLTHPLGERRSTRGRHVA